MTAPTMPTLEELIAILSKPFDEGHPDERMGALQSAVLTYLRHFALGIAPRAVTDADVERAASVYAAAYWGQRDAERGQSADELDAMRAALETLEPLL